MKQPAFNLMQHGLKPRLFSTCCSFSCRQGKVHVCAKSTNGRLTGGHFYLDFPSVGATETLMMAAALADGETVLSNVAQVRHDEGMDMLG